MIKKILVSLVLLFSAAISAQSGSSSPYSFYGIGDVTFKGSLDNRSMGGVSVFSDSIHLNLQNPASLAALKNTTFTLGFTDNNTRFVTNSSEGRSTRDKFDYFALGFPVGKKFGASFGLMPYSSVGYRIQSVAASSLEGDRRFEGEGGLNKAYFAFAYKLTPKINAGINIDYNFGTITTTGIEAFPTSQGIQYGTREQNESRMSGLSVNLGLMFQSKLKNKMDVFGSLTLTPESNLNLANKRNLAIIADPEGLQVVEQQDLDVTDSKMKLPSKISFGGGFGIVRKWLIGSEITLSQSSHLGSRFEGIDHVEYENSWKTSLGGYYIPNFSSYNNYFKRITYRGGLRYEKTGLVIAGKSIADKAFTLGLGLPLRGSFSNVNIGFEVGTRGTRAAGLVEERYHNLSISLSLNDRWFVKRKYD